MVNTAGIALHPGSKTKLFLIVKSHFHWRT